MNVKFLKTSLSTRLLVTCVITAFVFGWTSTADAQQTQSEIAVWNFCIERIYPTISDGSSAQTVCPTLMTEIVDAKSFHDILVNVDVLNDGIEFYLLHGNPGKARDYTLSLVTYVRQQSMLLTGRAEERASNGSSQFASKIEAVLSLYRNKGSQLFAPEAILAAARVGGPGSWKAFEDQAAAHQRYRQSAPSDDDDRPTLCTSMGGGMMDCRKP